MGVVGGGARHTHTVKRERERERERGTIHGAIVVMVKSVIRNDFPQFICAYDSKWDLEAFRIQLKEVAECWLEIN